MRDLLASEGWKLHHLIILGASNCLCRGLWQNEDSWTVSQSLFPMLYLRSTLLLHSSPHKCAPPPSSLPSSGMGWRPVLWSPPVVTLQKVSPPQTSASQHFGLLSIRQNEPGSATYLSDCKAFSQALTSYGIARNRKITEIKSLF